MRYIFILLTILSASLLANDTKLSNKEKTAINKIIEQENQFAKEQKFYQADEYDFKSMEVDKKTIKHLGEKSIGEQIDEANEDFDMDDVY